MKDDAQTQPRYQNVVICYSRNTRSLLPKNRLTIARLELNPIDLTQVTLHLVNSWQHRTVSLSLRKKVDPLQLCKSSIYGRT